MHANAVFILGSLMYEQLYYFGPCATQMVCYIKYAETVQFQHVAVRMSSMIHKLY